MKQTYNIFILTFIFLLSNNIYAQYVINKNVQDEQLINATMQSIYNFEFEQAEKQLTEIRRRFPNHPVHHFLSAMQLYWKMVPVSIENPDYKLYEYHLLKTIELATPLLKSKLMEQEATFFTMAAQSSMIYIYVKSKDFGKAVSEGRKTYEHMKNGFEWTDTYPDFNFSSGLYYFYAEQYPETHPVFQAVMWFFTKGNKENGIKLLKIAAEKSLFSKTEAIYFLAHAYLKYYNLPIESLKYSRILIEKYPNNYYFMSRYAEGLVLAKKFSEAKIYIDKLIKSPQDYYQLIGYVFNGFLELNAGNYTVSKRQFEYVLKKMVISKYRTQDYEAFAYMGMAQISVKENNLKKAHYYFNKLEEIGEYKIHRQELIAFKERNKAVNQK